MKFGFEPVCDQLRTSFEPANLLRTSFEADSVMEFGREPAFTAFGFY